MKYIAVSIPVAVSGAMRLYVAYVLTSSNPNCSLLTGAFLLALSVYSLDRIEEYNGKAIYLAPFTSPARYCT